MEIITVIIILFGLTTIMGLYLSFLALQNKQTPNTIIILHGFFTTVGFILLAFYYPESVKVMFYFGLATCFGLVLLYQDFEGIKYTKWLCYAHAVFTFAGCLYLWEFSAGLSRAL